MIKLIAIDMDGTVLNTEHVISERNIKAIKAAQKEGIEVIISTGRGYPDGVLLVEEAGLKLAFSCMNGAELRNKDGEIIHTAPLLKEDLQAMMDILDEEEIFYDMYINEFIYTKDIQEQIDMFIRFSEEITELDAENITKTIHSRLTEGFIIEVNSFDEAIADPQGVIYKMLALSSDLEKLARAEKRLEELPGICISTSAIGNLEITNIDGQKGVSLEKYAEIQGVSLTETMAIGDNFNDISMMQKAGIAVAMDNAPDEIKGYCHWVTESNNEDGVGIAIEKLLNQMK